MLFRASLHFYAAVAAINHDCIILCQCSSELHFISTLGESKNYGFGIVCQCSSELHFISTWRKKK